MPSAAKIAANKANAQRSTGPRTPIGKAAVRWNALRHGLRADIVVVPQLEDPEEWDAHRAAVTASLAPQTYLEELLADCAALATWRMQRAARYERSALTTTTRDAEKRAFGNSSARYIGNHPLDADRARKQAQSLRAAVIFIERLDDENADLEEQLENEVIFSDVLEHAAAEAGIALEKRTDDEDGSVWWEVPEVVYERAEDRRDYWPTLHELRGGFDAIAKHATNGRPRAEIVEATLLEFREKTEYAEQAVRDLDARIETERDASSIPADEKDGALLLRYETAAERSLERALASIKVLRESALGVAATRERPVGQAVLIVRDRRGTDE